MEKDNGYIAVGSVFKSVSARYVGVGSLWKNQNFRFVGKNGYWVLVYSGDPISFDEEFYVTYLEGYTLEKENSISIYGVNLRDYQLVSPRIGGYFELENNATDVFQNFGNGSFIGSPIIGELVGGKKGMLIATSLDYFQLPSDLDARGVFGTDGKKDYNLSSWFYIESMPVGTDVLPLLSFGNGINGMEVVISSDGRFQQKLWNSHYLNTIQSAANLVTVGWNSYVITRVNNVTSIYIKGSLTAVATSNLGMIAPEVGVSIIIGASFKYSTVTELAQAFSISRTDSRYALSNENRTITAIASGYSTARSNNKISKNSGKYYWEAKIDNLPSGVIWVGLGDASLAQTVAPGVAGWSISSNSRTFNKQTGGGTTWGSGANSFTTGDTIGCVYDSALGSATWYKNNILLGTSTSAIDGDVDWFLAGDINTVSTIRIKQAQWLYTSPVSGANELPATVTYSGLTKYSLPGNGYKYFFESNVTLTTLSIQKLLERSNPVIVLKNKQTLIETIIAEEWILTISNTVIIATIPNTVELGNYDLFVRYNGFIDSFHFPIRVQDFNIGTSAFTDDFKDDSTLKKNYYVLHKAWGGSNGGVVKENVFIRGGELILKGNGDNYIGSIQGVDRIGNPKFHTDPLDPQFSQPWTNRVGGCIVYNKRTGFGSYEIDALIPNKLGCAYAMWTFFYNEVYPTDPRYNDFLTVEGLHEQGTVDDGYYVTRNHEIDIEFPSHLDGGILSQPSLLNFKANTWRGELQNWDVDRTDPSYWEEYRDNLTPVGFNIADGNFHKLRYDWYPDRVEFYIDGVLRQTNVNTNDGATIPDIPGFFTFGIWFPSSPLSEKPWLCNPSKSWGGGVIDTDGGMKADFDSVEMRVREFKFTPFNEYLSQQINVGETYPFGGYNKK